MANTVRLKIISILLLILFSITFARTGARYLIICPDNFVSALQPLANWKTKKGVKAMIVPLSVTGSSSSQIKTYILNAYNNWPIRPEYILLAGAGSVLPSSGTSDDYYADMSGNYRIELSVGRFPATTVDQIQNIVNKTIKYERTPFIEDTLWYLKGTTIVREDYSGYPATSYPDTYYWQNARYCFTLWLNNGFIYVDSFSRNRGHTSTDVINAITNGRTFIVFRGQSVTNWWSPFATEPENTNNGYKLPVIVSGTCATMSLSTSNYLGDKFINAGNTNNPKGAVGYFGSTVTSSGTGLAVQRGTVTTSFFRALFEDKIIAMGDAAKRAKYLLDSIQPSGFTQARYNEWNLFGDPELNLWTQKPRKLTVIYDSVIPLTQSNMLITVHAQQSGQPLAQAQVCIKMDTLLYAWGYTNPVGQIELPIQSQTAGIMDITVTAPNFIPFEGTARLIQSSAPYIILHSVIINDSLGNNDGKVNPGEIIKLPMYLSNIGTMPAHNIIATLRTSDSLISVLDSTCSFATIGVGQIILSQDYCQFFVNSNIQHNYQINFQILIQDDQSRTWYQQFNLSVFAGKLFFVSSAINDSFPFGNGNMRLGPNESARIYTTLNNIGENLSRVTGLLRCSNQYTIITDSLASFGNILSGQTAINLNDAFAVSASPNLPKNHPVSFSIVITGDGGTYTYQDIVNFSITTEMGTTADPIGPDNYGYWAYDNSDTLSGRAPTYNWFEIGPTGPGSLINEITNQDAAVVTLGLPFRFKYYGQNYDSISVCSNGFLAMGRTSYRFGNNTTGIPDTAGPSAMIAPLWCDLDPSLAGDIYQYYDIANHRWIVEFYQVPIYNQSTNRQTFQVILFDPNYYPTVTGDGELQFIYQTINPPSLVTVGIENQTETIGIQYLYNSSYHQNAAIINAGRAIKFSTLLPTSYQSPWIALSRSVISDSAGGNNNGIPEPNETIHLTLYLKNRGSVTAQNVIAKLKNIDGDGLVIDSVNNFGNILPGTETNNQTNPFIFQIISNPTDTILDFILLIQGQNYSNNAYFSIGIQRLAGIEESTIDRPISNIQLKTFPNPFRYFTNIEYALPSEQKIELKIYNTTGQLVKTLVSAYQKSGIYRICWNGKSNDNKPVPSGIYYYVLKPELGNAITQKLIMY